MALPSANTPTRIHSDYVFVKVADSLANLTSSPINIGQATNYSMGESSGEDSWRTFGSGEQLEAENITYDAGITVLRAHSQDELYALLGVFSAPTPGDKIRLDPTAEIWVQLDFYTKAGVPVGKEIWEAVKWRTLTASLDADDYAQLVFEGLATDKYEVAL